MSDFFNENNATNMYKSTLEDHFAEQSKRLDQLTMATTLIQNKESITSDLISLQNDVGSIKNSLCSSRADLEKMKNQNESMKRLSNMLDKMKDQITHMESNLPPKLLRDYANVQLNEGNNFGHSSKDETPNYRSSGNDLSDDVFEEDKKNVGNCKKILFDESPQLFPKIKLIEKEEFDVIPKYMIGRQSLDALNQFLATINDILKAKYTLMAMGINGAKKKGEYDLYMIYKKQENTAVGKGKEKFYFFTAEDYHRHTKTKLQEKTKLNFLTVLRHCRRLREVRVSKAIQYTVVSSI